MVPTANPFSKKRQHSEITKAPERPSVSNQAAAADEDNDIQMDEELKSAAASDAKMQSMADNSVENASAAKAQADATPQQQK